MGQGEKKGTENKQKEIRPSQKIFFHFCFFVHRQWTFFKSQNLKKPIYSGRFLNRICAYMEMNKSMTHINCINRILYRSEE